MADDSSKYTYEVKIECDKSNELYSGILDLFIDAIQGRYSVFHFKYQAVTGDRDNAVTEYVKVTDPEDDNKEYTATRDTIHKGLCLMLADDGTPRAGNMAQSYVPSIDTDAIAPARTVALALITGGYDVAMIDGGDADCIVQLGLLGEVRYG